MSSRNNSKISKISKTDKFHIMTVKNVIWGIIGLTLGVIINDIVIYISNKFHIKYLFIQNMLQITLCAIVVSFLHTYYLYGWDWQDLTPELFFVSFFFGVQYKILTNIQHSYQIDDTNNYNNNNNNNNK